MKKFRIIDALEEFKRSNLLKGLKQETMACYDEKLSVFISWLPSSVRYCRQLNYPLFEDYLAYLRGRFSNPNSINCTLRPFRAFVNFCASKDYLVPFKVSEVKTAKAVKPTYDLSMFESIIFDRKEVKQSVMCLLFLSTGIRSKTLRLLKVCDFDYAARTLTLSHLKNGDNALLPLPEFTANRLKRYISEKGLEDNTLLFPTKQGVVYTSRSLNHYLTAYLKRHGFQSGGIHKFRHTFGKYFSSAGGSSIALARFFTHGSVSQSEQYTALYGQDLRPFLSLVPAEQLLRSRKDKQKGRLDKRPFN